MKTITLFRGEISRNMIVGMLNQLIPRSNKVFTVPFLFHPTISVLPCLVYFAARFLFYRAISVVPYPFYFTVPFLFYPTFYTLKKAGIISFKILLCNASKF